MKFIIAFVALVAVAAAAPTPGEPIAIVRSEDFHQADGSYKFAYETANGIVAEESGQPDSRPDDETPAIITQGKFSWTSPEGQHFEITYVADHDGFHPSGAHLGPAKAAFN